jgi:hypothetical protein
MLPNQISNPVGNELDWPQASLSDVCSVTITIAGTRSDDHSAGPLPGAPTVGVRISTGTN